MYRQCILDGKIDLRCSPLDELFRIILDNFFFLVQLSLYLRCRIDKIGSVQYTMIEPLTAI